MIVTHNQEKKKRILTAPPSTLSLSTTTTNIPSTVISVEVAEDESVEWIWTIYPNCQTVVTGYNIIKNS